MARQRVFRRRDRERLLDGRCYVCGLPTERERTLLNPESAARICRVTRATIYRWMARMEVEWVILPMGRRRIFLDSLFKDPPRPMDAIP